MITAAHCATGRAREDSSAICGAVDPAAIGAWNVEVDVDGILARARKPSRSSPRPGDVETDFFGALGALDQGYVLLGTSGSPLVAGEQITLGDPDEHGRRRIVVDGKPTAGFVDASGKIAHASSRRATHDRPDSGPLASTWCRYYHHDDRTIRQWLVELVPELRRFARGRRANRVPSWLDLPGGDR